MGEGGEASAQWEGSDEWSGGGAEGEGWTGGDGSLSLGSSRVLCACRLVALEPGSASWIVRDILVLLLLGVPVLLLQLTMYY